MYVLAINGSPRKDGNTEIMLEQVLAPLKHAGWETNLVQIGGKVLRGCIACEQCWKNKNNACVMKNDLFNELFQEVIRADAIVLGSPTYFSDVTAEMKAFIDRAGFVALANDAALRGKIGAAVVVNRRGGAIHAYDTINHMFQINQMIIPGSTYWNQGNGLAKGEVVEDVEALSNMKNLGETIAWLGQAIHPHIENLPGTTAPVEIG